PDPESIEPQRRLEKWIPGSLGSLAPRNDGEIWIAHMGNGCVKDEQSPFCSTAATRPPFRPDRRLCKMARAGQVKAGPLRGAAQRLGLELSEHAIMLGPSGPIGACGIGGLVRASAILAFAIQGS